MSQIHKDYYSDEEIRRFTDEATAVLMEKPATRTSNAGGWMMIATILIEAWDLYAISFLLVFIKGEFKPTPFEVGWITGAVQFGALIGAIVGGWFADRFGRRKVFLTTMVLFIVLAIGQAFATGPVSLIFWRLAIGIPLGSDIANGYAYIMESMPKGKREVMGSRWQFMFGAGEVASILVVTAMYMTGMGHGVLWRVGLAMGAIPALVLLLGRLDLPETPMSLIERRQFKQAKASSKRLFNDDLAMLPAIDFKEARPRTRDFLAVIWKDPIKRRGSIFGWISNACQGAEFTAWAFYLPVILTVAGIGVSKSGSLVGTNLVTAAIFTLATISGFVAPLMLSKIGHRGLAMWGFGLAFVGLVGGAFAIKNDWRLALVLFAGILMWGHYWDASNGMTITSVVAPARFRGTASGFGYIFVKLASFFGAFVFPVLTAKVGAFWATMSVSILSLIGFLAAKFILPEVFNFVDSEAVDTGALESRASIQPA